MSVLESEATQSWLVAGAFSSHRNTVRTALANDLIVIQRRIVAHGTHGGQFYQAVIVSTLEGPVCFESGMKSTAHGRQQRYTGQCRCSDTTLVIFASANDCQLFRVPNLTEDGAGAAGGRALPDKTL